MSLLPPFNSGMPSYFAPPLKGELEKLSPTEIVARTLLSMHRQKSSSASYEIKAASGISEADVARAVTKIEGVFNSSFTKSISPSKTENLALLLLHLEEGAPAKQILDEFNKLKYEDLTFLCDSVSQGDPDKGLQSIKRDPFLLLRVKNSEGKNPLEALLEKHKCQEIKTHLRALERKSLDEIKASPYFGLLCNFIRWEDGGKEDPHFGSAEYGEAIISANPKELFSGAPSRIDRFCINLDKVMQSDRDRGGFHEIAGLSSSFAKADTEAYAKIAQAMPKEFDLSNLGKIKDEKLKIEILKISVADQVAATSQMIDSYKFKHPEGGRKQAHFVMMMFGAGIPEDIQNYGITDQAALIEIAKIEAKSPLWGISMHIKNYRIDPVNQEALIEIAKISAAHALCETSMYIENYGITDQKALIDIAKVAARMHGEGTSGHIKNYRIDPANQEALIEIAKIAAVHDGLEISKYIKNYGITSQAALIEIAKIAVAYDGPNVFESIQNFGIDPTNQKALIEIAKIAAARDGYGVSQYIQSFGIAPTNQEALIEIAEIAAAQNGYGVSLYIQNYGINPENQAALIEIVRIAASQFGRGISEYIQNYRITSQDALIKIAKIAAVNNAVGTSIYIQNYGITSQEGLIEIARLAASNDKEMTSMHILNYGITSAWEIKNAIEPGCLGVKESLANVSLDATYTVILGYRNPAMKLTLALEFLVSLGDEAYRKRYASLLLNKKGETIAHLRLPMVFVAKFMETPECPEGAAIRMKFLEYREKWKDAKSNLLSSALNTLNLLDKNSTLSSKQKLQLLSQVAVISTDASSLKLNLQKMGFLLATHYFLNGSEDLLKQRTSEEFNEIFIAHIKKQTLEGGSVEPVFIEKYLELSFTQRESFALEQYAARIEEPLVKEEMNRFILSIVNGGFRAARYSARANPHLMELASYRKEGEASSLWERWQNLSSSLPARAGAGAEEDSVVIAGTGAGAVLVREAKETTAVPSFKDWLYQKLIMDKHLLNLSEKLPHLLAFLNKTKESEELLRSESLKPIERACLLLCSKGSLDEKLVVLKDLKAEVEKDEALYASEWKNDIEAMLLQLTSKGAEGFKGVITDDWQDLFLCGTEVSGSCQRIDGDPSLNKCLLGYCMDGKVQMIALKDPKSGKLLARAVLKLLLKEETDLTGKKVLKPVVFLERIYANTMSDSYIKAINALAIERAKALGIELYTWNDFPSSSSEVRDLSSLGSSSPYEYEDGGVGVSKGVYLIHGAKKVILA